MDLKKAFKNVFKVDERISRGNASLVSDEDMAGVRAVLAKHAAPPVAEVAHYVMEEFRGLERSKSVVKPMRVLGVMAYLVRRLPSFRPILFGSHLRNVFAWPIGAPQSSLVKLKALELIGRWDRKFGAIFPLLRAFSRFLRESKGLCLGSDSMQSRTGARERVRAGGNSGSGGPGALIKAYAGALDSLAEARTCLTTLDVLFQALSPDITDGSIAALDDIGWEDDELLDAKVDGGSSSGGGGSSSSGGGSGSGGGGGGGGSSMVRLADFVKEAGLGSTDYPIEITFKSTEDGIRNAGNAVLVDSIKETAVHLVRNVVPRLRLYGKTFSDGRAALVSMTQQQLQRLNTSVHPSERERIAARVVEVTKVIDVVLKERCKPIFGKSGARL